MVCNMDGVTVASLRQYRVSAPDAGRCAVGRMRARWEKMKRSFPLYRLAGHRFVPGWLEPEVLDIVHILHSVQRDKAISGAIAEIGVHHGKFFIGLRLLQGGEGHSLAVDVFDDQHLNVDRSGLGDRRKFLANICRWASSDGLIVHQGDSTALDSSAVRKLAGSPVRLFSVDGGHSERHVLYDMQLAEGSLAHGGVVIGDDVFNERWPGVAVGTLRYLQNGAGLIPFAIGFNKVFFTQPAHADSYRRAVEAKCKHNWRITADNATYSGHEVALLWRTPRTPRGILRKNATATALYRRLRR